MLTGSALMIVYLLAARVDFRKAGFYGGLVLMVAGVLHLSLAAAQSGAINSNRQAIVFKGVVNVKAAPGESQKTVFVIHEGTKVSIKAVDGDWINAELANGNSGWLPRSAVEQI